MNSNTVKSRVTLEIDLDGIERNYHKIAASVAPLKVLAVLKADAYGLGVSKIAERLAPHVAGFCVAELKEALELVRFGKSIQILGGVLDFELQGAVENGIILGIGDIESARRINDCAASLNRVHECHFKIDTGMGRLGIVWDNAMEVIREAMTLKNIRCCGIYSHFPDAYKGDDGLGSIQLERFYSILEQCRAEGINFEKIHIANSDAVNNLHDAVRYPFNYVRTGLNLYGVFDPDGKRHLNLDPVLTLKTHIVSVRRLPAGYTIGYGRTCRLVKDTLIGTLSAGYADGLPNELSNRGYVLVKGLLCPILGRLSMDYTTVSLEQFKEGEVLPGDDVICLGRDGENEISADNWSQIKGTHPYDIICSIGNRVERVYISIASAIKRVAYWNERL